MPSGAYASFPGGPPQPHATASFAGGPGVHPGAGGPFGPGQMPQHGGQMGAMPGGFPGGPHPPGGMQPMPGGQQQYGGAPGGPYGSGPHGPPVGGPFGGTPGGFQQGPGAFYGAPGGAFGAPTPFGSAPPSVAASVADDDDFGVFGSAAPAALPKPAAPAPPAPHGVSKDQALDDDLFAVRDPLQRLGFFSPALGCKSNLYVSLLTAASDFALDDDPAGPLDQDCAPSRDATDPVPAALCRLRSRPGSRPAHPGAHRFLRQWPVRLPAAADAHARLRRAIHAGPHARAVGSDVRRAAADGGTFRRRCGDAYAVRDDAAAVIWHATDACHGRRRR